MGGLKPKPVATRCPTCHRLIRRSTLQNSRYWILVHRIAERLKPDGKQFTAEVWHEFFKGRVLGYDEILMPNRKTFIRPKSSADLGIDEFSNFMQAVETWAAERDVYLDE